VNKIPTNAWFTVTRSCNFRCEWCYAKGTGFDGSQTLTIDLALRLLTITREMGIKNITIIGGEPTLWKHLMEFNVECRKAGIKTTLVTNAYRFGDDDYWNQYTDRPNDKIGASLKAFDSDSAKRIAKIHNFETLKIGLHRVVARFGSGISFVCNSFVLNDLLPLAKVAYECGARSISISPCTPSFSEGEVDTSGMVSLTDLVENIVLQYDEINDLFARQLMFAIKTPLCIWPRNFIKKLTERGQLRMSCQFQHRSGIIFGPKGQVMACNSMADFPIGMIDKDYNDAESLIQLFNSPTVVSSYNYINSYPSELCVDCPKASLCRGGCPLMWAVYNAKESIPGW